MKRVAVIGAGMAGAAAAWKLKQAGWQVTVYEKESYVGGRTHTYRGDGFHVNTGAGFFTNFYPEMRKYLKNSELESQIVENPKLVRLAGKNKYYDYRLDSVPSFFRIPWLSFGEKLRLLRHTAALTLKKRKLDLVDPHSLAPYDDSSMKTWAQKKLGDKAYQYLIRTAVEPYWYFSCEKGSAAMIMALTAWAAGARFFTLKKGMDQVVHSLLKGIELKTDSAVADLKIDADGKVQLTNKESSTYDSSVIATTASGALNLTKTLSDKIVSAEIKSFLSEQEYAANINAYFFVPEKFVKAIPPQISPAGPHSVGVAAIATHGSDTQKDKYPGTALIGLWLRDEVSQSLVNLPEAEVWPRITELMCPFLPEKVHAALKPAYLTKRTEAIPIHAPGRYRLAVKCWETQKSPLVFAGDYLTTATMEGAMQSGIRAAQILINSTI